MISLLNYSMLEDLAQDLKSAVESKADCREPWNALLKELFGMHDEIVRLGDLFEEENVSLHEQAKEYHDVVIHFMTGENNDDLVKRVSELRLEIEYLKTSNNSVFNHLKREAANAKESLAGAVIRCGEYHAENERLKERIDEKKLDELLNNFEMASRRLGKLDLTLEYVKRLTNVIDARKALRDYITGERP